MTKPSSPPFFTYQSSQTRQDGSKLDIYVPLPEIIVRTPSFHLQTNDIYFVQVNQLWVIDKTPVVRLYDKVYNRFDPLIASLNGRICVYESDTKQCRLIEIDKLGQQNDNDLYIVCCLDNEVSELIPVADVRMEPLQEPSEVFTLVTENGLWVANGQLIVDGSTFVGGDVDVDIQVTAEEDVIEKEVVKHIMDLEDLTISDIVETL